MLILGDHDHDFPVEEFKFLTKRFSQPKESSVITDADHYFRGHEDDVGRMAAKFFTKILGGTDPSE